MDELLVDIRTLKEQAGFEGTIQAFKNSSALIDACIKSKIVAKGLMPAAMAKTLRETYFKHLVKLAKSYINANRKIRCWEDFCKLASNRTVAKIFFEFGVKAEVFDHIPELASDDNDSKDALRITEGELYELSRIKFNFRGSMTSFRRMIVDLYGSYAEYCLEKGFDINQTNWEDQETAIRCAKRIGSIEQVKLRSKSLFKYLSDNGLIEKIRKVS